MTINKLAIGKTVATFGLVSLALLYGKGLWEDPIKMTCITGAAVGTYWAYARQGKE